MTASTINIIAGILCYVIGLLLSGIYRISSPKSETWMDLPSYVRMWLLITAGVFLIRATQFLVVSVPIGRQGEIQPEGVMVLVCLAGLIGSIAVWIARRHFPANVWHKLRWAESVERANPGLHPVMASDQELVEIARAKGVTMLPGDLRGVGPDAFVPAEKAPSFPSKESVH